MEIIGVAALIIFSLENEEESIVQIGRYLSGWKDTSDVQSTTYLDPTYANRPTVQGTCGMGERVSDIQPNAPAGKWVKIPLLWGLSLWAGSVFGGDRLVDLILVRVPFRRPRISQLAPIIASLNNRILSISHPCAIRV